MLSFCCLTVLHLTIVIHWELIFLKDRSSVCGFVVLHVDVQSSQRHLLEKLPLLHRTASAPLPNTHWPYFFGGVSISQLFILFHWPVCLYCCQCHIVVSTSGSISLPDSFFTMVLAPLGLLPPFMDLRISLSVSTHTWPGVWVELHWICRSSWGELASWQYGVFLSMNVECLSIEGFKETPLAVNRAYKNFTTWNLVSLWGECTLNTRENDGILEGVILRRR